MFTEFDSPLTSSSASKVVDKEGYERIFDPISYRARCNISLGSGENKSERIDRLDTKGVYTVYIFRSEPSEVYSFGCKIQLGRLISNATFLIVNHKSRWHKKEELEIIPQDIVDVDVLELTKGSRAFHFVEPFQKKSYYLEASKIIRLCIYEELCCAFAYIFKKDVRYVVETKNSFPHTDICHIVYGLNLSKEEGKLIADFYTNEYHIDHVRTREDDERVEYDRISGLHSSVKFIVDENKVDEATFLSKICATLRGRSIAIYEALSDVSYEEIMSANAENFLSSDIVGRNKMGTYVCQGKDFEIGKNYRIFEGTPGLSTDFWPLRQDLAIMFSGMDFDKCILSVKELDDLYRQYY